MNIYVLDCQALKTKVPQFSVSCGWTLQTGRTISIFARSQCSFVLICMCWSDSDWMRRAIFQRSQLPMKAFARPLHCSRAAFICVLSFTRSNSDWPRKDLVVSTRLWMPSMLRSFCSVFRTCSFSRLFLTQKLSLDRTRIFQLLLLMMMMMMLTMTLIMIMVVTTANLVYFSCAQHCVNSLPRLTGWILWTLLHRHYY